MSWAGTLAAVVDAVFLGAGAWSLGRQAWERVQRARLRVRCGRRL